MDQHGKCWTLVKAAAWALGVVTALVATSLSAAECRISLLLALDISSSVDMTEDALQRRGLAAALLAPEVQNAIFASDDPIALAAYEWSGRNNQNILVDWTIIDSSDTLLKVSEQIGFSQRSYNSFPTAIGFALGFGSQMMQRAPVCATRTIDMAGDGQNNEGFGPLLAYREFPFDGITVNGLVVNTFEADAELLNFYRREVLHGPGAFLEVAEGFEDYERAMRRKLERELSLPVFGAIDRPVQSD